VERRTLEGFGDGMFHAGKVGSDAATKKVAGRGCSSFAVLLFVRGSACRLLAGLAPSSGARESMAGSAAVHPPNSSSQTTTRKIGDFITPTPHVLTPSVRSDSGRKGPWRGLSVDCCYHC